MNQLSAATFGSRLRKEEIQNQYNVYDGSNNETKAHRVCNESKEFIESVKNGNAPENEEDIAAVMKLKLERNLEKLNGMIKKTDDPEIKKVLEDYEASQLNAEDMLAEIEVFIIKYKEKRQIELNEKAKSMKMEQKGRERQTEMEHQEN